MNTKRDDSGLMMLMIQSLLRTRWSVGVQDFIEVQQSPTYVEFFNVPLNR